MLFLWEMGFCRCLGESSWAFNLQTFGVSPFQAISIWLLGYCIIIYVMAKRLLKISSPREYTKFFVFFGMLDLSSLSYLSFSPTMVVTLVPFIIAVLDNFDRASNYIFKLLIFNLFLFYPMKWMNNIDLILSKYIFVVPINGNNSIILVTLIAATLVIWAINPAGSEKNGGKSEVDKKKNLKRDIILPLIILISPLATTSLMPLIIDNSSPISNQAENWNNQDRSWFSGQLWGCHQSLRRSYQARS